MARYNTSPSQSLGGLQASNDRLVQQVLGDNQRERESARRSQTELTKLFTDAEMASEATQRGGGGRGGPLYSQQQGSRQSIRNQLFDTVLNGVARRDPEALARALGDDALNRYSTQVLGTQLGSLYGQQDPAAAQAALSAFRDMNSGPPMSADAAATDVGSAVGQVGDTDLGEALAPHARARNQEFAADFAAVSEQMGQPGITRQQAADLQSQFEQRYPEYAKKGIRPQPMTKEQAAQVRMEAQRQQANVMAKQILEGKIPDEIMTHDRYGQLVVAPGIKEMWQWKQDATRQEAQSAAEMERVRRQQYLDELKILESTTPPRPSKDADPAEVEAYNRMLERVNVRRREIHQQMYDQPVNQPVQTNARSIQQAQQQAQQNGYAVVADQADFDDLPPGTTYIWSGDGKAYVK